MRKLLLVLFALPGVLPLYAQMYNGADTLYGNEWINFSTPYYKISVPADGVYRIPQHTLSEASPALAAAPAASFRVYCNGRQVPVFISTDGIFGAGDYLEFFAHKNRGELDRFLFTNPEEEMLNPRYSMFNDTAAYYLCIDESVPALRINSLSNNLNNPPPPEPFCWYTEERVFGAAHFKRQITYDLTMSWFYGEGFCKNAAATSPVAMPVAKLYPAGNYAHAAVRYACNFGGQHEQQVKVSGNGLDSVFFTDQFGNYRLVEHQFQVPAQFLGNQTKITIAGTQLIDKNSVASVSLTYPRLTDAGGAGLFSFRLDSAAGPRYLEIAGFSLSGNAPVLYDLDQGWRLETTVEAGLVKVLLPAAGGNRNLILFDPVTQINAVEALKTVVFHDFSPDDAGFILLTHKAFFNDPLSGGANHVAEYAAYRSSAAGGGYTVAVVDIEDLYAQFSYGVRYHPLAVRNFTHWVQQHWSKPAFLFLVGKGLNYELMRDPAQSAQLADSIFYLPTFGTPGTDQLFMTGNSAEKPIFPVGRLAVTSPAELGDYLEKVKVHEANFESPQTIADRLWMKKMVHIGGGSGADAVLIRDALEEMAQTIENNRFGAKVSSFYKTSSDPVQVASYEQILQEVNSGVALMTMIGHSTAQVIDFDIGTPDLYNNHGRYPVIAPLGCFTGSCSMISKNLGEQFMLARDRGAIAYFAFAYYSHYESLRSFGQTFYERIGGPDYGKTLGEQLAATVGALQGSSDQSMQAVLHQLVLQGDPAIRIPSSQGPDYTLDNQTVKFTPNPISVEQGNFNFEAEVVNLGEHSGGQIAVRVEQKFPDGSLSTLKLDTIAAPAYRHNLQYSFPAPDRTAIGLNRFFLTVDPGNAVEEMPAAAELNNELQDANGQKGMAVYAYADDVMPLFPPPFAIVAAQPAVLKAATFNVFAPEQGYRFEIDTTPAFNSGILKTGTVQQSGGLLSWTSPLQLSDSTVYYWRVGRDSLVDGKIVWHNSSFVYLSGSEPGWNQSHFYQFAGNGFENLQADTLSRKLQFPNNAAYLTVSVAHFAASKYPGIENSLYEGFSGYGGFIQRKVYGAGVVVALVDPLTGKFVVNPKYSSTNPDTTQDIHFHFFKTQELQGRLALMDFLKNDIPNGYYVGLLTLHKPTGDTLGFAPGQWAADSVQYGMNLFQLLEQQGATRVRDLENTGSRPYGLIFRQNTPGFAAIDTIVTDPDALVELRRNFFTKWTTGKMNSVPIGPAASWGALHWRRGAYDNAAENTRLRVFGIRHDQPDTLFFTLETGFDAPLSGVDAKRFPLLRLELESTDTTLRTVPDLGYLRVLYAGLPEGGLNPAAVFEFYADTLQQGELLKVKIVFDNFSNAAFDSLWVKYRVESDDHPGMAILRKYRPLPAGDTLQLSFDYPTLGLSGPQRLLFEVNPDSAQPELYHFNNLGVSAFYVRRDQRNPLLDVTFDGFHIMDGDVVSPQPEIVATLKDDNRILAIADTATFQLSVGYPDGSRRHISWNDPQVQFIPADPADITHKNMAKLEFRPEFSTDGNYSLIINGRDASGNASGALDYTVKFKVITRSSFSNLLNYPNPFSTSTCFVYTLTGAELPADFVLRILTVSGKVVREITAAEFGPIRAGTHQSSYCWDGRDEFGDQLANGVYLYRVIAKKADGSDFELFQNSGVDGMFQNGWGKMVIMR